MVLPENVDYVGWAAVKDLRGFDPEELADLFKSYGIRCRVYEGKLLTENNRTAERTINVLYDAKHYPKWFQVKQALKVAGKALLWYFGRLMCYAGQHEWTCDAFEGKKPAPGTDILEVLNGYAKMYCQYCGVESVPGWWKYKEKMEKYGICTLEEWNEAMNISVVEKKKAPKKSEAQNKKKKFKTESTEVALPLIQRKITW